LFDDPPIGGEEFGDFSFSNDGFSSEASASWRIDFYPINRIVPFAYFLCQDIPIAIGSNWGLGQRP